MKPISTESPSICTGANSSTTLPSGVWQRTVTRSSPKLMRSGFFRRSVIISDARSIVSIKVLQSTVIRVFLSFGITLS